jgi:hypothetical protein
MRSSGPGKATSGQRSSYGAGASAAATSGIDCDGKGGLRGEGVRRGVQRDGAWGDGGGREAERAPGAALAWRRRVAQDRRPVLCRIQQQHPGMQHTPTPYSILRRMLRHSISLISSRSHLLEVCVWQGACVMNTLDSVVDALARDPARKFVVVEQVHRLSPMMCSLSASLAVHSLALIRVPRSTRLLSTVLSWSEPKQPCRLLS